MKWPTASCTHRTSGHLVLTAKVVLAPPSPRSPHPSILSGVQMAEPSPRRPASTSRETGQCILIRATLHRGRNFNWDIGVDTLNKWGDLAVKRTLPTLIGFLTPRTAPSPLQLARVSDSPPPDDGISPRRVHISQDWFSYLRCHSGMTCAAHKHVPSSRQLADPWFWCVTKAPHVYVENLSGNSCCWDIDMFLVSKFC